MRCSEFLDLYSDYRDGRVGDPAVVARLRRHLLQCPRCARYDARISRGVTVLRSLSALEPTTAFRHDLVRRLGEAAEAPVPLTPAPAGLMVGLMIAAAILLLVWPSGSTRRPVLSPPAQTAAAHRPLPAIVVTAGPPFVGFTELTVPAFSATWRVPGAESEPDVGYAIAVR
jgi:anti-sigma factor RsiW